MFKAVLWKYKVENSEKVILAIRRLLRNLPHNMLEDFHENSVFVLETSELLKFVEEDERI